MITNGEQTRLDFNLSFYGYIEGIELKAASPRKFGPPVHDPRGKHAINVSSGLGARWAALPKVRAMSQAVGK